MAREKSEDAVTWNVLRFLYMAGRLSSWIESLSGNTEGRLEDLVLWSYSLREKDQWALLNEARRTFGELAKHVSEPDAAIITSRTLVLVESKLGATNDTSGIGDTLAKRLNNPKLYTTGAGNWFSKVFHSGYETIVTAQRYELMRLWLLGTWMARQLNRGFLLLLVMREEAEPHIPPDFQAHITPSATQCLIRTNWEDVFDFISQTLNDAGRMLNYLRFKTLGYDANGVLKKAFNIV